MAKKRLTGFSYFMIIMVLIALAGLALLIFGAMTNKPFLPVSPWMLAKYTLYG